MIWCLKMVYWDPFGEEICMHWNFSCPWEPDDAIGEASDSGAAEISKRGVVAG
jgi:hypothetical protein